MKTTSGNTPASNASSEYERLLSVAQAAQSAADRAVADLASIKRTMAEAPRVTQLRREELARAQAALEQAEAEFEQAREQIAHKQAEAARLIEVAAEAQRALAQALIAQDVMPEGATWNSRSVPPAMPAMPAPPRPAAPRAATTAPTDATLGRNRYTPTPAMHPADLHAEVVEYMAERDALCPSCGHSLRGIETARCPGCKLQLSVNVLKSVRATPLEAPTSLWVVRGFALVAMLLSAYLALVVLARTRPFGCGVGSDCHFVIRSDWSRLFGVPVAGLAAIVYAVLLLATGFVHIGLTDTTRRRAWSVISVCAAIAGAAGLWFIAVQALLLKAICPHCLVADICGVIVAAIVLSRAPLGREEKLPERAAGPITISKPRALGLVGGAVAAVAVLAGLQFATAERPSDAVRQQFSGQQKPKKEDDGLLMKPLDIDVPPEKAKTDDKESPAKAVTPTPSVTTTPKTTPKDGEDDGGLLLPGLDIRVVPEPPKPPTDDGKGSDKQPDAAKNNAKTKGEQPPPPQDNKDEKKPEPNALDFSGTIPNKPLDGK